MADSKKKAKNPSKSDLRKQARADLKKKLAKAKELLKKEEKRAKKHADQAREKAKKDLAKAKKTAEKQAESAKTAAKKARKDAGKNAASLAAAALNVATPPVAKAPVRAEELKSAKPVTKATTRTTTAKPDATWTVVALRAKARADGVVGYSRLSKEALLARLR